MTVQILKKLTTKTVMGSNPEVPKEQTALYTVAGIANATKHKETTFGPYVALIGDFIARRNDGQVFRSMVCILPEPMGSALAGKLEAADSGGAVQFALTVYVRPNERSSTKYEYVTENKIAQSNDDPVMALLESATGEKLKELPHAEVKPTNAGDNPKPAKRK